MNANSSDGYAQKCGIVPMLVLVAVSVKLVAEDGAGERPLTTSSDR